MQKRLESRQFQLEELGITHIKNRDVILRNISHNQDIAALKTLSKVCEPLKIYNEIKTELNIKPSLLLPYLPMLVLLMQKMLLILINRLLYS